MAHPFARTSNRISAAAAAQETGEEEASSTTAEAVAATAESEKTVKIAPEELVCRHGGVAAVVGSGGVGCGGTGVEA